MGRKLLQVIRIKKLKFHGDCCSMKDGLESLLLAGKIEGTRSKGRRRRRVLWMSSLKNWLNERMVSVKEGGRLLEKARIRNHSTTLSPKSVDVAPLEREIIF